MIRYESDFQSKLEQHRNIFPHNYSRQHCSGLKQIYIFIKILAFIPLSKISLKFLWKNSSFGSRVAGDMNWSHLGSALNSCLKLLFSCIIVSSKISFSRMQINFHVCYLMNASLLQAIQVPSSSTPAPNENCMQFSYFSLFQTKQQKSRQISRSLRRKINSWKSF